MRIITALMLWAVMGTAGASACYQVWDRDGSLVYRGSSIPVDLSWPPVGDSLDRIRQGGMHLVMGRSAQCSPVLRPEFAPFVDAWDRSPAAPAAIPPTAWAPDRQADSPAQPLPVRASTQAPQTTRQAQTPSTASSGQCPPGSHWVRPYNRRDGTSVSGHCRRS
jgi:hypothetical protein